MLLPRHCIKDSVAQIASKLAVPMQIEQASACQLTLQLFIKYIVCL